MILRGHRLRSVARMIRSTFASPAPMAKPCTNCGYDLAYCSGGRCPECGMFCSEGDQRGRIRRRNRLVVYVMCWILAISIIAMIVLYLLHLPSMMADEQIRRRAEIAGWSYETRSCTSRLRALCRQLGGYPDSELFMLQCAYSEVTARDAHLFGSLRYLHTLDLRGCDISESAAIELGKCRQLVGLNLHKSSFQSQNLTYICDLTNLKGLIVDSGILHDGSIKSIERLEKLESLILGGNMVSDESMFVVGGLTGLKRIVLSGTSITDRGIAQIGELPNLNSISIYGGDGLTADVLQILAGFDALKQVVLVGIPAVNAANVEQLRAERPDVEISVTFR